MAKRKFAGLREEIDKASGAPPTSDGKGKAPGKSSHPDWSQHTVMLRKATHRAAAEILFRQNDGTDMSDLLERLLADWVKQRHAGA